MEVAAAAAVRADSVDEVNENEHQAPCASRRLVNLGDTIIIHGISGMHAHSYEQ